MILSGSNSKYRRPLAHHLHTELGDQRLCLTDAEVMAYGTSDRYVLTTWSLKVARSDRITALEVMP